MNPTVFKQTKLPEGRIYRLFYPNQAGDDQIEADDDDDDCARIILVEHNQMELGAGS